MLLKLQINCQKLIALIALIMLQVVALYGQELNCSVSVNDRQISGSSYDYISELSDDIKQYLNENRWTEDRFEENERILCNIQIVLTNVDTQFNFTAEAVFSVRRPIYNTSQYSSLIVIGDNNWRFNYPRNKSFVKDELQFDDLTSFLDFYANIMLGFDYDSFSEMGGSQYFNRALNIFELGQNSGSVGWGRSIGAQRNRFGLINDLTNPAYRDLRQAMYQYHRHGLDQFTLDPITAADKVIEAISVIRENKRLTSNNYLFDLFFDTKYTEITALLQFADVQKRTMAYNLLTDVDPAHSSEYQKLQN